jgi:hypothetical protein
MRSITALLILGTLLFARPALAEEDARLSAENHYAEGLRLLQAGDAERALVELETSAKLISSPNTDLLRGHALRELGRRVDAMIVYEAVVRDAGARVRAGETRYEATLADAGRWVASLRNQLAELVLELRVGKKSFSAKVDAKPIRLPAADPSTGIARVRLCREPGSARIRARLGSGSEHRSDVEISAGTSQTVSLDLMPATAPRARPAPSVSESHAPPLASYVAWGIGAAGLGVFAVAGSMARARMNELDECAPSCTNEQTDQAEQRATIANVGLAVGIVGAVAGGAIWLGSEATRPSPRISARVAISDRGPRLWFGGAF